MTRRGRARRAKRRAAHASRKGNGWDVQAILDIIVRDGGELPKFKRALAEHEQAFADSFARVRKEVDAS